MFVMLASDDGYRTHVVTDDHGAVGFIRENGYESYQDGHDVTVYFRTEVEVDETLAKAETLFG